MRKAGCSFTLEVTPNDELIPHIDELRAEAKKYVGADCHVTIARDDAKPDIPIYSALPEEEFYKTWEQFDSNLFTFKKTILVSTRTGSAMPETGAFMSISAPEI